jgi:hypothetical protein
VAAQTDLEHDRAVSPALGVAYKRGVIGPKCWWANLKIPKYTERSHQIRDQLATWSFSREVQQRLGTLAVLWGVFESNLETTLWALRGASVVTGMRRSTDKTGVSDWIKELASGWPNIETDANELLHVASLVASDLMGYRHAIMHGAMLPAATMPSFIRNPRWHGEHRKRPTIPLMLTKIFSTWP